MTFREQWNDERLRYHDDTQGNTNFEKTAQLSSQNTQKVLLCHRKRKVQLQWGYRVVFCSRDARILFTFDLLLSVYLTLLGRSERELQCISQVFSFCAMLGRLKYLTLTDPTKVWMPDTFFRNEKEARKHEIIVPNVYVRIFPDGEILYSIR